MTPNKSTVDTTLTTSNVAVDFSSLGSAVWSNNDATSFCYRSEIKIGGQLMNFDETIVTARVDRTNEISSIASIAEGLEVSVEYQLVVYVCE